MCCSEVVVVVVVLLRIDVLCFVNKTIIYHYHLYPKTTSHVCLSFLSVFDSLFLYRLLLLLYSINVGCMQLAAACNDDDVVDNTDKEEVADDV